MKKTIFSIAIGVLMVSAFTACGPKKPKLLTEAEISQRVDSIYQMQSVQLAPELDKLCDAKFETLVQGYVDSIVTAANPPVQ